MPLPPPPRPPYLTFRLSPRQYYLLSQMGAPDIPPEPRETENDQLKRELEALKPELQLIKSEVGPSCAHAADRKLMSVSDPTLSTSSVYQKIEKSQKGQIN